ncbi:hypothetical protein LDVICp088 [lymphocystis disease virus-China]|uniref:Uncharacterized protein n=1 Tax=lymphocystis disease virus-China TaxID=256729 RepID=Q678C4_9VIRU|nr:hypothetical protein LDVICp088 [lymphocystis disease virus-China]AAU10933.1 hypothetical protein [lymphocystis disease virus-China]
MGIILTKEHFPAFILTKEPSILIQSVNICFKANISARIKGILCKTISTKTL